MMTPVRILLVEDDESASIGLAELLEGEGYPVRVVNRFEDGLHVLRTDPPDLLIADIRLGSFNGLQLVLRGQPSVPSIVITGYDDPVLADNARSLGATYFVKPIDPTALLSAIVRITSAARNVPS